MTGETFDPFYNFQRGAVYVIYLTLDFILINWVYLFTGFILSSLINDVVSKLDRNKSKVLIFTEISGELMITLTLFLYFSYFITKIPSIVPNLTNIEFRERSKFRDFLLVFAVMSTQLKLLDKIKYLFNDDYDNDEQINEQIRENFNNCPNGFTCAP